MKTALLFLLSLVGAEASSTLDSLGGDIAAIKRFASEQGDRIWRGFGSAPFDMLLIEAEREVLLCRATLPPGFTRGARHAETGCETGTRARSPFPAGLLAAMPVFGPPSTIVMGTPEAASPNRERWRSTILHEHFHQWQNALPGYWQRTEALGLAGDDKTGMWMLNFPFPYERADVAAAFRRAATALGAAVEARGRPAFKRRLRTYLAARRALASAAGEQNWRYFELQLWQEGVARWTELELAARHPDPAMRADAAAHRGDMMKMLAAADLPKHKRVMAYPFGAAEAMLLEACGPRWRGRYPQVLALGPLLDEAAARCAG